MIHNFSESNSFVNQILFELREKNIQTDRSKFRGNMHRLGSVMAYELSKSLEYSDKSFETPLESMVLPLPELPIVIGVLRAALPFMNGFLSVFDQADSGFIGAYRQEGSPEVEIDLNYAASPLIEDRVVCIVDPMLATGKSFIKAIEHLTANFGNPKSFHLVCAIATPEGIDYISSHLKNDKYTIWAGAVDSHLNDRSYIIPGLGDAGDLSYGIKKAQ
ncbi:MAG: uracil phosphoribosyltransferase [Bacteroidota bacterium]